MAFVGVELQKNERLESWVGTVMEGFANANTSELGRLASQFEIIEAPGITKDDEHRLFLVNAKWSLSSALWIVGFLGGIGAYAAFGKTWILTISFASVGSAFVFSNWFLRAVIRLSLWKQRYKGQPEFLTAEDILRRAGVRTIARTFTKQED